MTGMKRLLTILSLVLVIFITGSCSMSRSFQVTSCSVASISPSGLKGVKAVLNVGIINHLMGLTVTGIDGVINNNGEEFATFEAGKVSVPRRSEGVYPLNCSGAVSKGVGLTDLLKLAVKKDFSEMTVDMAIKVRLRCGLGKTIRIKDLKVTELMEPKVAAAYLDLIINEMMI